MPAGICADLSCSRLCLFQGTVLASLCVKRMPQSDLVQAEGPWKQQHQGVLCNPAVRSVLDPSFLVSPLNWDVGASTWEDHVCLAERLKPVKNSFRSENWDTPRTLVWSGGGSQYCVLQETNAWFQKVSCPL